MKNLILVLFVALYYLPLLAQKESMIVRTGESVENIILQVDKLLKDSLNPNIQFNEAFAQEAYRWLDLKISGVEKTDQVGTAHMYSRIIADEGLFLELILQGVNKNIAKINSGDFKYQVGTNLSGIPDYYFADAVERSGITYFIYCFD